VKENWPDDLPLKPTDAERERARGYRSPQIVRVEGRYEVRDGALRKDGFEGDSPRWYFLAAASGLLKETAQLNAESEKSLTAFAARWGLLGYQQIVMASERGRALPMVDPLIWVWAHVRGIQTVIGLYKRLNRRDEFAVAEYMAALPPIPTKDDVLQAWLALPHLMDHHKWSEAWALRKLLVGEPGMSPRFSTESIEVVYGQRQHVTFSGHFEQESPMLRAWDIILAIVNANAGGTYRQLWRSSATDDFRAPDSALVFDSTLSAAYWQLQNLITAPRVKECEECHFLFEQGHGLQRFCPPTDVERKLGKLESRCALRARQRRHRGGES